MLRGGIPYFGMLCDAFLHWYYIAAKSEPDVVPSSQGSLFHLIRTAVQRNETAGSVKQLNCLVSFNCQLRRRK